MTLITPSARVRGTPASRAPPVAVGIIAATFATVAALWGAGLALRSATGLRASWPAESDSLMIPPVAVLRVLSLGHREMAADLVAARANVYFGSQVAARGEHRWLGRALETAVTLDPHFHRLYMRGAAMLVYTGRTITVESVVAANNLLRRGMEAFPGDWELPFQLGFNLLFELPKLVGENDQRAGEWRQQGVEALRQATLLDGVPPWLPNLAARMLTKQGGEELAIRHLQRTFEVTSDPATRVEISRRLAQLRSSQLADQLATGAAALDRWISERYPYAPEAFSLILGPRLADGVDLDVLLGRNWPPR